MAEQTAVMDQAHGHHVPNLAHHFEDMEQQREAGTLGMWIFLSTEILLFGALFAAYTVYRFLYPDSFALAQRELNVPLGAINTGVLLCSSLTMALAVRAAQLGQRKGSVALLIATMILGLAFIGIKGVDWYEEYSHNLVPVRGFDFKYHDTEAPSGTRPDLFFQTEASPESQDLPEHAGLSPSLGSPESDVVTTAGHVKLFFTFYFIMTGLHALHMLIGVGIVLWITFLAWRGAFSPEYYNPVEISGLYWHFVDIVWVFLFPVLYLI